VDKVSAAVFGFDEKEDNGFGVGQGKRGHRPQKQAGQLSAVRFVGADNTIKRYYHDDMNKPPYEITGSILSLYGKINDRLGQCKGLMLVRPEAHLRRDNRIKTIQSSLAIEGNTLEIEQVTAIMNICLPAAAMWN